MAKKTINKKVDDTKPSYWALFKAFFTNERTRFITGLVCAIVTIYIGLALISFFFTGAADQSKIENVPVTDLLTNQGSVENWTGVRGAFLPAEFLGADFGQTARCDRLILPDDIGKPGLRRSHFQVRHLSALPCYNL